jgi:hypothetical protein
MAHHVYCFPCEEILEQLNSTQSTNVIATYFFKRKYTKL